MAIPPEAMGDDDGPSSNPGYRSRGQLAALSNNELADYIAACTYDYDHIPQSVRVALVRLLRHLPATPTIDSVPSCGQGNDDKRATDKGREEIGNLTKLAAECHRAKWQFDFNNSEIRIGINVARRLLSKAFDELHRIGDLALTMRNDAKAANPTPPPDSVGNDPTWIGPWSGKDEDEREGEVVSAKSGGAP